MASSKVTPYETLQSDLAKAIRSNRTRCPPTETARLLLSYDSPATALIGLSADAERVIYHDRTNQQAIASRFDETGMIRGSGIRIAETNDGHGLRWWIAMMGSTYWCWLHPRYRPGP